MKEALNAVNPRRLAGKSACCRRHGDNLTAAGIIDLPCKVKGGATCQAALIEAASTGTTQGFQPQRALDGPIQKGCGFDPTTEIDSPHDPLRLDAHPVYGLAGESSPSAAARDLAASTGRRPVSFR
ncbi:hypothetical protein RRG08_041760 [Elysia crispata]|uniref:Uncharacterized protein n=1 Tax=Elysia crispata TaxID=231223 RepID=A0AAE0Z0W0_9GAST|nr:hypothetical protein RRG08_041760 [Elysia crispata]